MTTALVTMPRYLRAEALRLKGSSVLYFAGIGVLICISGVMLSAGAQSAGFQSNPLAWQAMYVTGMAAPLMMLLAGLSEQRERVARNGGIAWRGASVRRDRLARLCGVAFVAALFQCFSFGGAILFGAPLDAAAVGGACAWLGALALLGLGAMIARRFGVILALVFGIVWQVLGTLTAELAAWWLIPPAWPVRIMLVPIGVQANGEPMPPTHPALNEPHAVSVILCVCFALVVWAVSIQVGERQPAVPRTPAASVVAETTTPFELASAVATARRNPRALPVGAMLGGLKGSGVLTVTVLAALVMIVSALAYSPGIVSSLFAFAVFPIGTGILPVLAWRAQESTYTQVVTENPRTSLAFAVVHVLVLVALSALVTVLLISGGVAVVPALGKFLLWLLVGTTLLWFGLALMVRFGTGAAISAMIIWTLIAITLGGDVLADTFLWIVAFPVWPQLATTPARYGIAVVLATVGCVLAAVALRGALRVQRRYA
ncbi:hypothetical protein [Corynebacterium sp.]|uniref:hypothetical protein n=1 Tax=Corynebacterium sp. TaxID=1720 RepID=UPI0026DC3089|nr:hypothetical protein [Corynebacterium sp.]MDO5077207.1 hypothetical protein [Corynebacterium sp.]